jgi:3',5'-cyclic AMP phosphodiesterase CpdA
MTSGCAPYYAYFGASAGPAGKGYYSYNLANNWHVIVLNSQGTQVGGTGVGSPQEKWLKADLAANKGKHIVAMWHIPVFTSGLLSRSAYDVWWQDLYAAHADLVLDGHDHLYERFALQSPAGKADPNGIREFIVGTGGAPPQTFGKTRANSQVRSAGTFGVLQLTLGLHSYSWKFIPIAGKTFTDSGTQATHS